MATVTIDNTVPVGDNGASSALTWSSDSLDGSTADRWLHSFYGSANVLSSSSGSKNPISGAGTLRNLVALQTSTGVSNLVYTVQVNGVDTGLTVTVNSGSTTASDTTHTVAVLPGDIVTLKCVSSATSTSTLSMTAILEFAT
jgi:hypothetical protein